MSTKPRPIFNPLTEIAASFMSTSSTSDSYVSESSLINTEVGVCPKCKSPMTRATIAGGSTVFYCESDRVAMPLPNTVASV